jgi:hypothetical protein
MVFCETWKPEKRVWERERERRNCTKGDLLLHTTAHDNRWEVFAVSGGAPQRGNEDSRLQSDVADEKRVLRHAWESMALIVLQRASWQRKEDELEAQVSCQ